MNRASNFYHHDRLNRVSNFLRIKMVKGKKIGKTFFEWLELALHTFGVQFPIFWSNFQKNIKKFYQFWPFTIKCFNERKIKKKNWMREQSSRKEGRGLPTPLCINFFISSSPIFWIWAFQVPKTDREIQRSPRTRITPSRYWSSFGEKRRTVSSEEISQV